MKLGANSDVLVPKDKLIREHRMVVTKDGLRTPFLSTDESFWFSTVYVAKCPPKNSFHQL